MLPQEIIKYLVDHDHKSVIVLLKWDTCKLQTRTQRFKHWLMGWALKGTIKVIIPMADSKGEWTEILAGYDESAETHYQIMMKTDTDLIEIPEDLEYNN